MNKETAIILILKKRVMSKLNQLEKKFQQKLFKKKFSKTNIQKALGY